MEVTTINENSPSLAPPNLTIELFEHQKRIIYHMAALERTGTINVRNLLFFENQEKDLQLETRIGILGDRVGSGKSLECIGLLATNNQITPQKIHFMSDKYVSITSLTDTYTLSPQTLLIIPDHLHDQWINFFKHAPHLKIGTDIIILTPKTIKHPSSIPNPKTIYNRIFIDEADTIKLDDFDLLANFIWLITGTPSGISVSKKKYIKKLFGRNINWLPDMLTIKSEDAFLTASIALPVQKRIIIKCFTPPELTVIKQFIPNNIIQMINAGSTDQAIKTLNCHVDTKDNIFKVIIHSIENIIHNLTLEIETLQKKKIVGPRKKQEVEQKITKLNETIKKHNGRLTTIKHKVLDINTSHCPICMDEFTKQTMLDCCGTSFCFECLTLTSKNKHICPHCQQKVNKNAIHVFDDTKKSNNPLRDKLQTLMNIVSTTQNKNKCASKYLIFANFAETFAKIRRTLTEASITNAILKGSQQEIQQTINEFNEGTIKVLMLNATNWGAGLNLQCATDVIIYHRFTKELEQQVIGRAQRIGRTSPLNVYYLIHNNETDSFPSGETFDEVDYEKFLDIL